MTSTAADPFGFNGNGSLLDFSIQDWGETDFSGAATPSPIATRKRAEKNQPQHEHTLEDLTEEASEVPTEVPPPPPPSSFGGGGGTPTSVSSRRSRNRNTSGGTRSGGRIPNRNASMPDTFTPPNFASPGKSNSFSSPRSRENHKRLLAAGKTTTATTTAAEENHKRMLAAAAERAAAGGLPGGSQSRRSTDQLTSNHEEFEKSKSGTAETTPSSAVEEEEDDDEEYGALPPPPQPPPQPPPPPPPPTTTPPPGRRNFPPSSTADNESVTPSAAGGFAFEIDLPPADEVSPLSCKESVVAAMMQRAIDQALLENATKQMMAQQSLPFAEGRATNQLPPPPASPHTPDSRSGSAIPSGSTGKSRQRLHDRSRMQKAARGVIESQKSRHRDRVDSRREKQQQSRQQRRSARSLTASGTSGSEYEDDDGEGGDINRHHRAQRRTSNDGGDSGVSLPNPPSSPRSRRRPSNNGSFNTTGTSSSQEKSKVTPTPSEEAGGKRRSKASIQSSREREDRRHPQHHRGGGGGSSTGGRHRRSESRSRPRDEPRRSGGSGSGGRGDRDGGEDRNRRYRSRSRGAAPIERQLYPEEEEDDRARRRRYRSQSRGAGPRDNDYYDDDRDRRGGRRRRRSQSREQHSQHPRRSPSREQQQQRRRGSPSRERRRSESRDRRGGSTDYDDDYYDDDRGSRRNRSRSRAPPGREEDEAYENDRRRRRKEHRSRSRAPGPPTERDDDPDYRYDDDGGDDDDRRRRRRRPSPRGRRDDYDDYYDDDDRRRRRSRSRRPESDVEDGDRRRRRGDRSKSRPRDRQSYDEDERKSRRPTRTTSSDDADDKSRRSTRSKRSGIDNSNFYSDQETSHRGDEGNDDDLFEGQRGRDPDQDGLITAAQDVLVTAALGLRVPPSPMRAVLQEVPRKAVIRDVKRRSNAKEHHWPDAFNEANVASLLHDVKEQGVSRASRREKDREEMSRGSKDGSVVSLLKDVKEQSITRATKREKEREEMNQFQNSRSELLQDVKHTGPSKLTRGGGRDTIQGTGSPSKWGALRAAANSAKEDKQAPDGTRGDNHQRSRSPRAGLSPRPGLPTGASGPSKWDGLRAGATFINATKTQSQRRRSNRSASPSTNRKDNVDKRSSSPGPSKWGALSAGSDFLNETKKKAEDRRRERRSNRSRSPAVSEGERREVPASPASSKWGMLKSAAEQTREQSAGRETMMKAERPTSKRDLISTEENEKSQDIIFVPADRLEHPTSPSPTRDSNGCVSVQPKLTPVHIKGTKVMAAPINLFSAPLDDANDAFANRAISTGTATDAAIAGIASKGKWSGVNRALKDTLTSTASGGALQPTEEEFDFPDAFPDAKPQPKVDPDGCVNVQPKITPVILGGQQRSKWDGVRGSVDFLKATRKQLSGRKLNQQQKQLSSKSLSNHETGKELSNRSLSQLDKPRSNRSLESPKKPSNWNKLKHVFTFVSETKNAADRRHENDKPPTYDTVGGGSENFKISEAESDEYRQIVLEQANQAVATRAEFHPAEFDASAFGEKPKQSNWSVFSKLVKENKEQVVSKNDTPDADGCVKVAPRMAPVILKSQEQTAASKQIDDNGFALGETTQQGAQDGLVQVRPKMAQVVLKSQPQMSKPNPTSQDDGLVQVQPKMAQVVLKSQQQQSSFPVDAFQNIQPDAFSKASTGTNSHASKWAGVKASADFINSTKRKARRRQRRGEQESTESAPTGSEETKPGSKWAGLKIAMDKQPETTPVAVTAVEETKASSKWAGLKSSIDMQAETTPATTGVEEAKPKSKWAGLKSSIDMQAEKPQPVSSSGAEAAEIKFVPEAANWDRLRKANELIEEKKKRREASRARQQDLEKSTHSTQSNVSRLSQSTRNTSDNDLSALSADEIQFTPTHADSEPTKPSKWDLLKSASGSTVGSAQMEPIEENKAAEVLKGKEDRRKNRRSKWEGVKTGMEFINKTKQLAEESKAASEGTGKVAGTSTAKKPGAKKAGTKKKKSENPESDNIEISLPGAPGVESDVNVVIPPGAAQVSTRPASKWADLKSQVNSNSDEGKEARKEKRVSRWKAMKKGMDFIKTTKQEVDSKTESPAPAATVPTESSGGEVKRSMWETLKQSQEAAAANTAVSNSNSPSDGKLLDKEARRAERKAQRASKSRWTGLKSGIDFISKTKKLAEDNKAATKQG